ncbi:MAG TPA: site-2 protease family protein [Methylomirabilota bacterium]|nr:site-2 protease family protein [Methylomirabilota bacterium]
MSESSTTSSFPTFSIDFGSIRSMLEYRFTVKDAYVDVNGLPTFIVMEEPVKQKFQELLLDLRNHQLTARIQRVAGNLVVSVFPRPTLRTPRLRINLMLFLATIVTVGYASYTLIFDVDPRLTSALFSGSNLLVQVTILSISILGIVGIHELGHVLANRHHKMDATLPYFVPAPPPFPFGTFGAVISLRSPPGNRDQLFDLGFSGPIAGFLATIVVALFAYLTAPLISEQQAQQLLQANLLTINNWPKEPLLLELITGIGLRIVPQGQIMVLTQIAFAAEVGALITFLNILPVWQLDGGHIARATFGDKGHKLIALVGFGMLFLAGYWGFAVILIIFMFLSRRPFEGVEPLDDVSPLSNSRKALFAVGILMLVLCFFIFAL